MSQGAEATRIDDDGMCPECGSDHLVADPVRGEVVCDACGLVIQGVTIDEGPDWSSYSVEESERLAHAGAPRDPLRGAAGLTTVILPSGRDGRGNRLRLQAQRTYHRLGNLQRRSVYSGPGERSLPDVVRVLDSLAAALDLPPSVKEEAGFLCRKAIDKHLLRGRSTEAVVAGVVYAACRIDGVPRTLDELQRATGLPKTTIGRVYRTLRRILGVSVPVAEPLGYVRRFCSELALSPRVEAEALRILAAYSGSPGSAAVTPAGTTAAAVYLASIACEEHRSQREIARVAGISEVTLRNRFHTMAPFAATAAETSLPSESVGDRGGGE